MADLAILLLAIVLVTRPLPAVAAHGSLVATASAGLAAVLGTALLLVVATLAPGIGTDGLVPRVAAAVLVAVLFIPVLARRPALAQAGPAIVTNASLLAVVIHATAPGASADLAWSAAAGLGFTALTAAYGPLQARLAGDAVAAPLRGAPLHYITAGILALGLAGLTGILRA